MEAAAETAAATDGCDLRQASRRVLAYGSEDGRDSFGVKPSGKR